ncbi:MAG TPA: hypothetical protein VLB02_01980, partial [Candidatus Paceibacterota bacterium]|nr:hypothetical protein [Candidatus Paceibacterota bacterium]
IKSILADKCGIDKKQVGEYFIFEHVIPSIPQQDPAIIVRSLREELTNGKMSFVITEVVNRLGCQKTNAAGGGIKFSNKFWEVSKGKTNGQGNGGTDILPGPDKGVIQKEVDDSKDKILVGTINIQSSNEDDLGEKEKEVVPEPEDEIPGQKVFNIDFVSKSAARKFLLNALDSIPSFRLTPHKLAKAFSEALKKKGLSVSPNNASIKMENGKLTIPSIEFDELEEMLLKIITALIGGEEDNHLEDLKKEE